MRCQKNRNSKKLFRRATDTKFIWLLSFAVILLSGQKAVFSQDYHEKFLPENKDVNYKFSQSSVSRTLLSQPLRLFETRPTKSSQSWSPILNTAQSSTPEEGEELEHYLVGSYYSVRDGLTARLMLNNKGTTPRTVYPILFSKTGQELSVAPVTVEANSFRHIDLADWIELGGESFKEGNIRLRHTGKDLVIGAQIYVTDDENSFSFEEKFIELGKFDSRRLEGIWSMPSPRAAVKIILTNNSSVGLTLNARLTGNPQTSSDQRSFTLLPHETRVLDLEKDWLGGGRITKSEAMGFSIEHSGAKWALNARGFISEKSTGYSNLVQFYNPLTGLMNEYHGAGIQMRSPTGERLKPVIVLRNTSNEVATVTGKVPYTREDGSSGSITLPVTKLDANEVRLMDTGAVEQRNRQENIQVASLELKYNIAPGSVGVATHSESQNRNFVSRVPMYDPLRQNTATGGYPWLIEGTSVTKNYIKNITDRPQKYIAFFIWQNQGMYMMGEKELAPHQTVEIDPQELRDNQVPDENGKFIPPDIARGQFQWSLVPEDVPEPNEDPMIDLAVIGRSEQIDWGKKVSNNYACQNCCVGNVVGSSIDPDSADVSVGGTVTIRVYKEQESCYGLPYSTQVTNAAWSSSNSSVATVSGGTVTGQAAGTANINAQFQGQRRVSNPPCPPGDGPYRFPCEETVPETEINYRKKGNINQENADQRQPGCGQCFSAGYYYAYETAVVTVTGTPHIDEIAPTGLVPGQQDVFVRIVGNNFGNNPTVNVSGTGVTAVFSILTPDGFDARFTVAEDAQIGQRQVTVTANGRTSNAVAFTVGDKSPVITSISQSQGNTGQTLSVTITGQNFGFNPLITFSQPGISYAISSATTTQINATFTIANNASPGPRDVKVISRGITGGGFTPTPQQSDTSNGVPFNVNQFIPQPSITAVGFVEKNALKSVTVNVQNAGTNDETIFKLRRKSGTGSATFEDGSTQKSYMGNLGNTELKIKGVTESSSENNYVIEAEVNGSTNGQPSRDFTVVTISTLEFKKIDSDVLTNPGNGQPNTNVGERIFPDKETQGDGVDRTLVSVEAKVSPVMSNLSVYLSGYDLDDPSAGMGPIDPMGNGGNDNNGDVSNSKAGGFVAANTTCTNATATSSSPYVITIDCPTASNGIATARFKTTMQPGDNFAIAATLGTAYRTGIRTNSTAGTILEDSTSKVIPISGQANADNVPAIRSNMLTVWRRVHIEVDSMSQATNNYESGSVSTQTIASGTTVVNLVPNSPLEPNRFEKGRLTFTIGLTNYSLDVVALTPTTTANTTNSVTVNNPNASIIIRRSVSFKLYDDDDFDNDDVGSLNGDEGDNITEPDMSRLTNLSDTVATNALAAAYIRTVHVSTATIDTTDDSVFLANIASDSATDIQAVFTGRNLPTAANTDDSYWSVYVLGAYQHKTDEDADPFPGIISAGFITQGIVDEITTASVEGSGALIFKEIHTSHELNPVGLDAESVTTAHEVGHLFSGDHADGELMGDPVTSYSYDDDTLDRMRKIAHP